MIMNTLKAKSEDDDDRGIEVDVLVSLVCLEFGSGRRYVKEVIKDLEITKQIQIVDKKAYYLRGSPKLTK